MRPCFLELGLFSLLLSLSVEDHTVKDESEIYIYSWNDEWKSWIAGNVTNTATYANAVVAGKGNCPAAIEIPGHFTHGENTGPVEIIGVNAFSYCAD